MAAVHGVRRGDNGKEACMFEQTFVEGVGKTNKTWTVLVSFIVQMLHDLHRGASSR